MHELTLAGMRVLVLEDEILIAMDVEQLCGDLGAGEVVIARALADVPHDVAGRFDLAVVDVSIGGEPALEFARGLQRTGVPFVFATGYTKTDALFAAFPDVPVLSKPYGSEAFGHAVRTVLGAGHRSQAALDPSTCDAIASGP